MNHVIAVAAPIGGGKTALVKAIANRLDDSATIFFDHYEKITESPVQDLEKWIAKGASFDDFIVPGLADDLKKLKQGESLFNPLMKTNTGPARYILFEMPLGKEQNETAGYIDLLIWIDIPPDIALAQKLKEFTGDFLAGVNDLNPGKLVAWMDKYLDNYLKVVRKVLQIQQEKVSRNADIIIDGMMDIDAMALRATKEILARIPR
jgi:uridine kinase